MNNILEQYKNSLILIKQNKPLVHHITNFVTIQDCANITAAIGASPVMAYDMSEVEEITAISNSVVLNTGTPSEERFKAIRKSGKKANEIGIPIILDPVGVGASSFRKKEILQILEDIKPSVIKGNLSEIKFLAGIPIINNRGVDSTEEFETVLEHRIVELAKKLNCVIAVTAETDLITDGRRICKINRGTHMLTNISGSGCMTASLIGSFCGVLNEYFYGAVYGILSMDIGAEKAERLLANDEGSGMFKVRLFDAIYQMRNYDYKGEKGIYVDEFKK